MSSTIIILQIKFSINNYSDLPRKLFVSNWIVGAFLYYFPHDNFHPPFNFCYVWLSVNKQRFVFIIIKKNIRERQEIGTNNWDRIQDITYYYRAQAVGTRRVKDKLQWELKSLLQKKYHYLKDFEDHCVNQRSYHRFVVWIGCVPRDHEGKWIIIPWHDWINWFIHHHIGIRIIVMLLCRQMTS